MKLNIYFFNLEGAHKTAYIKFSKDVLVPTTMDIHLNLQKKYGDRIQYVIFTEGSENFTFSSNAAGDAKEIIDNTSDQDFEEVVFD